MKQRLLWVFVFFFTSMVFFTSEASARSRAQCEIIPEEEDHVFTTCAGEFETEDELRRASVEFNNSLLSSLGIYVPFTGSQRQIVNIGAFIDECVREFPRNECIGQKRNGLLFVCFKGKFSGGLLSGQITDPTTGNQNQCKIGVHKKSVLCEEESFAIDTAIGCVPIDEVESLIGFWLKWSFGVAGGVGIVLFIVSAFMIAVSSGDPERLEKGKGLFISSISGIILIIFSVFLLRFIGVNILGIF